MTTVSEDVFEETTLWAFFGTSCLFGLYLDFRLDFGLPEVMPTIPSSIVGSSLGSCRINGIDSKGPEMSGGRARRPAPAGVPPKPVLSSASTLPPSLFHLPLLSFGILFDGHFGGGGGGSLLSDSVGANDVGGGGGGASSGSGGPVFGHGSTAGACVSSNGTSGAGVAEDCGLLRSGAPAISQAVVLIGGP